MKKHIFNKYTPLMLVLILLGASSQPLIAYAFTQLSYIYSNGMSNIELSDFTYMVILIVIGILASSISYIVKGLISNKTMNEVRKKIFSNILYMPSSAFHQKDSGEYYNYVLKKVDIWQEGYYNSIWNMLQQALEIIFILLLIYSINILTGIICFVFLIPLILNNVVFPVKIKKSYNKFLEKDSKMVVKLKEFLLGFDVIKSNQATDIFSKRMNYFFDQTNHENQKVSLLNNISGTVANICVILSQFSGIIIGILLLMKGSIQIGHFIALIQLVSFVNEPVIRLINSTVSYGSYRNINKELEMVISNEKSHYGNITTPHTINNLTLDKVSYKYPGKSESIIQNLTYSFKKPGKYLVIGESGSGKTTLINLIMNTIADYEGKIYFDGQLLGENEIYSLISVVPQEVFIFDDTIRRNIDLLDNHSDNEIEEVIKFTKLDKLASEGLNTQINEEVLKISGGEKARIALARTLLSNKSILIFDEILSSLNNEIAYEIEKQILNIDNKIIIHIAHKYSRELMNFYDGILKLG